MTKLKTIRQRKGYTQRELADKASVNLRMYQGYEQGAKRIDRARTDTVKRIANALEVNIEDII